MNRISIFIFLLIWAQVSAAPDGKDLLRACELSVANGFKDIEGQFCEYYILPCNCEVEPGAGAGICLPDNFSSESLAMEVIDGLRKSPGLLNEYAGTAAEIILVERYPCQE